MAVSAPIFQAVIGLGNPGARYECTLHNAGFRVVDGLHARHNGSEWRNESKGVSARIIMKHRHVWLLKPMTFMNASGDSLVRFMAKHGMKPEELIVVHDDLDIDSGSVRVKSGGGHGGHNGLRSIIEQLQTGSFSRLRIGIGRPVNGKKPVDFVLSSPQNDEDAIRFQGAIETGISALEVMILENVKAAMDRYNRKKETNETVFE